LQETNFFDYFTGKVAGENSESGQVKYGYVIFGNGKDAEWNEGLPQAADGSESLDLGEWLDFVGGMREALAPADLLEEGKLKKILEKADRIKDAVEKSSDAEEKTKKTLEDKNNKRKQSDKPDSALCPTCSQKQDSEHIDGVNGKGTFEKLKNEKKTDKTQASNSGSAN
jgi:hypothetical protein